MAPEITSALIYAGPGPSPMMAAAAAWNNLAAELSTTASSYQSVISELSGSEWQGPSSASMVAAVQPYLTWMNSTAAAAQHAATQAMSSAAAFETAFAMTVPPPVIAANRALLAALVATNILGQNTAAIAATEAHYGEMWAQDAAAMYGYAGSSQTASVLTPLATPAPTTNGAGVTGQAVSNAAAAPAQTGLNGLLSQITTALQGLTSPLASGSGSGGILNTLDSFVGIPFNENTINGAVNTSAWFVMNAIPTAVSLGHTLNGFSAAGLASDVGTLPAAALGGGVLASSVGPAGAAGLGGLAETPVLAGLGGASSVGGLSVPASWAAGAPAATSTATLAGTGWTAAAEAEPAMATTVPAGMPAMASAGRGGFGFGGPRYGSKPIVMPKPVGVG